MNQTSKTRDRGWTFVEMLVAISLSAIFLGAASLVLSAISVNSKRLTTTVDVNIGSSNKQNFYGQSGNNLRVYSAPNYGKAAYAQLFRDEMLEDAEYCSAVFCLPRQLRNSIRPEFLRYEPGDVGSTSPRPRLDTPEAFRQFLAAVEPTSSAIYDTPIRNIPNSNRPNVTTFMLAPETDPGYIRIYAIYEIDIVPVTNVPGDYVTVRRYKNGSLTNYYDMFYESGNGEPFAPLFAVFERKARLAASEGTAIDRFKVSEGNPFTLLFLPDPAINPYKVDAITPSDPATAPRQAYENMTGKSSFLVALPMFPNF